jgi:hypothetical protein
MKLMLRSRRRSLERRSRIASSTAFAASQGYSSLVVPSLWPRICFNAAFPPVGEPTSIAFFLKDSSFLCQDAAQFPFFLT